MSKHFLWLLLFFQMAVCQQNQNWKGYFSYNQIKDVSESVNTIYVAAENALFSKNLNSQKTQTITTVDGLEGGVISAMYHSNEYHKTLVGYKNGLMIIIDDASGKMLNVVDIPNKNLPSNMKEINHFMEYNGIVYISCGFGIVQYKLATLEFGDTYFIGPNGKEILVYQTTVFNGDLYAVTQNNGMKKAAVNNPNLVDFSQWETFDAGNWTGIVTFNNQLIALNTNNRIYKYIGSGFSEFGNIGFPGLDLRANSNYLTVTTAANVMVYNPSLSVVASVQDYQVSSEPITFSCATIINENIYIGTNEKGIVNSLVSNPTRFEFILPDGPIKNNIFSITAAPSDLWAVYGDYDMYYNPYPLDEYGISKFTEIGWKYIPFNEVFNAESLTKITVNPNNEKQVYVSSMHKGLLKLENDVPVILYDQTNSGLETLSFDGNNISVRINGTAFDKSGNLWITNTMVENGLKVLTNKGQWQSYYMGNIINDYKKNSMNTLTIDKNGTKWIATYADGVVAFNERNNVFKKITVGSDSGNLPSSYVRAVAVDNRNQVWIGTNRGLRVLANSGSYFSNGQMKANEIIILENGLAQELMYEQFITDIVVNGSNQKWIGTVDSGVFLFSADGQKTIYHFTKDNSPLPSDVINDIDINPKTGEVFFATDKGMVSFQGVSTSAAESLNNVYVFPNPVRPGFEGTVKIAGLISKANIKITDIEGNLVYETTSEGGTVEWDTTAFGKYKVKSGVYMIFIASEDASDTAVRKVMIIR